LLAVILLFSRAAPVVTTPLAELLSGRTVLIDPGHGGPDPGCIRAGLVEKELTLDLARRLADRFLQAAMRPLLTRTGDTDLGEAGIRDLRQRKRDDLRRRAGLALQHRADVLVSIHANSFPSPLWSGAQVFHYPGDPGARRLARALQDALVAELGPNVRREKEGDFYLLAQAKVPAAMVEVGFLSNPREAQLLGEPAYRDRVATAIFHGVVRFLTEGAEGEERTPARETDGESVHREEWRQRWQGVTDRGPDEVVLYFAGPTNGADWLTPELRLVKDFAALPPAERIRAALRELARGPGPGSALLPVVPVGTRIRDVSLAPGEVAVDLSSEFGQGLTGGYTEALAVYAVVDTVAELAPGCKVRLTVGGAAPDLGHLAAPPAFPPAPVWTLPGREGGGAAGTPGAAGRRMRWWTRLWRQNCSDPSSRSGASPSAAATPWSLSSSGKWSTATAG
jgi:N-acetylmuramoyl-L-alanine amidase